MPEDAVFHASVRVRQQQDRGYRRGLPDPDDLARWADPDWTEPVIGPG